MGIANERPRPGVPWRGVLTVAALALLLALIVVLRDTLDPQARAAAAEAAYHRAAIAEAVQPLDILAAALWRLIPPALVIAVAGTGLAIAWRRWGWRESIAAGYAVRALQADRPQLPASLHTLHYHPSSPSATPDRPRLTTTDEAAGDPPESEGAPTFRTLLDAGQLGRAADGRAQPLILGYHQGQAITGDWRSLYSSGLGGLQGSGKTWTATALLAQSALSGAQLVICDPHAGDEESLAARVAPLALAYLCDVAEDERAILHAVKLADAELQRRKQGDPDRTPLIVAIDEWSALRRGAVAELLPAFVEDFSTEGRKLNCHVMLLGQRWDKSSVGDFRNTLASSYVHRMRPDEARMMTGLHAAALPPDTLQLPPGVAYLLDTRGSLTRVQIPYTTPADIEAVGRRLALARGTGHGDKPGRAFGFTPPPAKVEIKRREGGNKPQPETEKTAPGSEENNPETRRILAMFFHQGLSVGEIVKELWPEARSGTPYNERRAYVEAVIRRQSRKG